MSEFRPDPALWERPKGIRLEKLKSTLSLSYRSAIENYPELEFVVCLGNKGQIRRATYREFDLDVRIAAKQITERSRPQDVVVILGRNRYETVVYSIAALMTGRTLAPMNPDDGPERISEKCALLLSSYSVWHDAEFRSWVWPENDLPAGEPASALTGVNEFNLTLSTAPAVLELSEFAPGQPCVLIFTSGSTGYSKVVEQTEIGLLTNIDDLIERHDLKPGEVVATPLPIFHVNALEFALCCTLLSGAKLVLFERAVLPVMLRGLQAEKCTILSVVPTILRIFIERSADWRQLNLLSLRYIVTAAAPLSVDLVQATLNQLKVRIVQGYGLSEAINFSCLLPTRLSEDEYRHWMTGFAWPSIGTSLRSSKVSVLDSDGQELSEGEVGEIVIRGPTVMQRYRGDAEGTIFRHSYLHTGDLGLFHCDPYGTRYFFISGRSKDTVKRNGLTISLREIDDLAQKLALKELGISDVIAVTFPNKWSGEEIALVLKREAAWNTENDNSLKDILARGFSPNLRPKFILFSSRELRTPSGKPCRWHFTKQFEEFLEVNLGHEIRFLSDE